MIFPDLLFTGTRPGKKLDVFVFDDMKLNSMIKEDVIEIMRSVCNSTDILARQEMFKEIFLNSALRGHLYKLKENMDRILQLATRYGAIRCENEKYLVFLVLTDAVMNFYYKAAEYESTPALYKRFRDFFKKQTEESNYDLIRTELDKNLISAEPLLYMTYKNINETLRISSERPVTYMSQLIKCSKDLNIENVQPQNMAPHLINPVLINSAARLYPEIFKAAKTFYEKFHDFYNGKLLIYKSSLDFYLEIYEFTEKIKKHGISFCYPVISADKKINIFSAYDVTLLTKGETEIIPNDAYFDKSDPFFYLTGANGGGKTTYLRTVGITCLLFLNGCPAPCVNAEIYPLSSVYTHFPRDERFNGAGRNADEIIRVDEILSNIDGNSLVLLNETFSTTSEENSVMLTENLANKLYDNGEFGVYVTHVHAIENTKISYLNVLIDRDDSNRRTFKVAKQQSVYSSFAYDILKKYALTKEDLSIRFK